MTSALRACRDAIDVRAAAHAPPDDDAFAEAVARLRERDDASWRLRLGELAPIARGLAGAFADVTSPDDALGELALRAHERWIDDWLVRARGGRARVSLVVFLRDRMRDHLREERRRRTRRMELLRALPVTALVPAPFDAPDDALAASELRAQWTDGSPALDTVVRLRELGCDQREIARRTGSSAATVSRRLAALVALCVLGAALVLAIVDRHGEVDAAPRAPRAASAPCTIPDPEPEPHSPIALPTADRERATAVRPPPAPSTSARLVVNALPWCTLSIDGRVIGPTPQIRTDVRGGAHRLSCVAADGRVRSQSVVVEPGQTTRVILHFD
jgi:hypothetical protein